MTLTLVNSFFKIGENSMVSLRESLEERNRALMSLDVKWARSNSPHTDAPDAMFVLAMHKARYECVDIPDKFRHESCDWLIKNGHKRQHGQQFLPKGQLPD